ncbi:MAG: hypothetical protein ABFD76_13105 [Smithella sp.]
MTRIMMMGVVICCLFFFSGCATIMSHGPQTLHIISQPDGATCEITDTTEGKNIANATTPYTVSLERGAGYFLKKYYDVTLSKEGYMKEKITLTPELNFWYVCNIFLGGALGALIVDPLTGSMWTFHEKDVSVKLYPDTPDGQAARKADVMARAAVAKAKEDAQREKQAFPK